MAHAFIAIGANINPERNVARAVEMLAEAVGICAVSTFYETAALDRPQQPAFYNGVVRVETQMAPLALKQQVLREVESRLGRRRTADKYASRPIDLDLILYENLVVTSEELTLPDPDIYTRAFVAVPLHELAPELVLPDTGRSLASLCRELSMHGMVALPAYSEALRKEVTNGHPEG